MRGRIGRWISAGFAVVLGLLLVTAGIAVFNLAAVAGSFGRSTAEQDTVVQITAQVRTALHNTNIQFLRHLLLNQGEYAAAAARELADSRETLARLAARSPTPEQKAGWDEARKLLDEWEKSMQAARQAHAAGRREEVVTLFETRVIPVRDQQVELIDRLIVDLRQRARDDVASEVSGAYQALWILVGLALIALGAGSFAAIWLTRRIGGTLREAAGTLGSASAQILAATAQQASGVAEEASAVQETTTTVDEVKQTAQVAAERAQAVTEMATRTTQISEEGREAVEQTLRGMQESRTRMDAIAGRVLALSEQGQAIGEIITSVNDLTEQSSILAVNAAIEAARAGEAGKGFAVVAAEVRALAGQSRQATAQVREILQEVQRATQAAVMAAEQGVKAADAGEKIAARAGEAIQVLSRTQSEAAQSARQILVTTKQQVVGMDQIASAMQQIQQSSAENIAATQQLSRAAEALNREAGRLKELVSG